MKRGCMKKGWMKRMTALVLVIAMLPLADYSQLSVSYGAERKQSHSETGNGENKTEGGTIHNEGAGEEVTSGTGNSENETLGKDIQDKETQGDETQGEETQDKETQDKETQDKETQDKETSDGSHPDKGSNSNAKEPEESPTISDEKEPVKKKIGLKCNLDTNFNALLQWDFSGDDVEKYCIYADQQLLGDTDAETFLYVTEKLEPGKKYQFKAEAWNEFDEVIGESDQIDFTAPDNWTVGGSTTLEGNKQVYNLKYGNGTLNLNGYTLTVYGDASIDSSLHMDGGALYCYGNADFLRYSALYMQKANDYLYIAKDMTVASAYTWSYLTDGILELKGDFTQKGKEGFMPSDFHRVRLNGEEAQIVDMDFGSKFAVLEFQNFSEEGILFERMFGADTLESNDCHFAIDGETVYYGTKLEEDLEVDGDYVMVGGVLDLNGHQMTVTGDFVQSIGTVFVDGGSLQVDGDYRMQISMGEKDGEPVYGQTSSLLRMEKAEDLLSIGGGFYFQSTRDHKSFLKAGTMEVAGDLAGAFNDKDYNTWFSTSGAHQVVLTGSQLQTVSLSNFTDLEMRNSGDEGIRFLSASQVNRNLITHGTAFDGILQLVNTTQTTDSILNGDVKFYNRTNKSELEIAGTLYIDSASIENAPVTIGKDLIINNSFNQSADVTVKGDVIFNYYCLAIKQGTLTVEGDFLGDGSIADKSKYLSMNSEKAAMRVLGNFYYEDSSGRDELKNGTIEVQGDFKTKAFRAAGNHKVILSGDKLQTVDMKEGDYFAHLELQNYSEAGIYSGMPMVALTMVRNGCNIKYGNTEGDFGWTLAEDEVIDRDFVLVGDTLDLNGHHLTVQGNFVHMAGEIRLGGGTLTVEGSYSAEARGNTTAMTDGVTEIKGDFIQKGAKYINFVSSGDHKVLLNGEKKQLLQIEGGTGEGKIQIGNLELRNASSEGIEIKGTPYVAGTVDGGDTAVSGMVDMGPKAALTGGVFGGGVIIRNNRDVAEPWKLGGDFYAYDGIVIFRDDVEVGGDVIVDRAAVTQNGNGHVRKNMTMMRSGKWSIGGRELQLDGDLLYKDPYSGYGISMDRPETRMVVSGNADICYGNLLKRGTLEIKQNVVIGYTNTGKEFNIILSGDKAQKVTFRSTVTLGILDLQNTSEEGITIDNVVPIQEIKSNGGRLTYGGVTGAIGWTLNGDLEYPGNLNLLGGTLNLNGHRLTVTGDMNQLSGTVDINGGSLEIEGNYQIRSDKGTSDGILIMEHENDSVIVEKSFYTSSTGTSVLSDGVMEVKGDFLRPDGGTYNFPATGNHKLLLSGTGKQTINFRGYLTTSKLASLTVNNTGRDGVVITGTLPVSGFVDDPQHKVHGTVTLQHISQILQDQFSGNIVLDGSNTVDRKFEIAGNLDINGTTEISEDIIVKGKLSQTGTSIFSGKVTAGDLHVGGKLSVNGSAEIMNHLSSAGSGYYTNIVISNGAVLLVHNNAYISPDIAIKGGTLEVKGDLNLYKVNAEEGGRVLLSGTRLQTVAGDPSVRIAILELDNHSQDGVVFKTPMTIEEFRLNGCRLRFDDQELVTGWTLKEDYASEGDIVLCGGNLDLNGHKMIINGDLIQVAGSLAFNGGSLKVSGNYRLQSRTKSGNSYNYDKSAGTLQMTGPKDVLEVGRHLYLQPFSGDCVKLSDGTMILKGDFYSYYSYYAYGNHTMVFSGDKSQSFNQNYTVSYSRTLYCANLRFESKAPMTSTATAIYASGSIKDVTQKPKGNVPFYIADLSRLSGGNFTGNLIVQGNSVLENNVTVDGNLELIRSLSMEGYALTADQVMIDEKLDVGRGMLTVAGNLSFNSAGCLIMEEDGGYVLVRGNVALSQNSSVVHQLTAGTLEVSGDFVDPCTWSNHKFIAQGTHTVILSGKFIDQTRPFIQTVKVPKPEYFMLNRLVLRRSMDRYRFYVQPQELCRELITEQTDEVAPERPGMLTVASTRETSVNLTWKANSEEDLLGYEIFRDGKKIGVSARNVYVDTGLKPDTEYRYTVTAFDEENNRSEHSPEVSGITKKDTQPPSAPSLLKVKRRTGSTISLEWYGSIDNVGVRYYKVARNGKLVAENVVGTEFTDTELSKNVLYNYTVIAVDTSGNESEESSVAGSVSMPEILEVTPAGGTRIGQNELQLGVIFIDSGNSIENKVLIEYKRNKLLEEWQPVHTAYLGQQFYSAGKLCANVRWNLSELSEDGEYRVKYTLYDQAGNKSVKEVSYYLSRTAPEIPKNLTATSTQQVADLGWEVSDSAICSGYRVYRKKAGEENYTRIGQVKDRYTSFYRDSAVEGNTEYTYAVSAIDEFAHESELSQPFTIVIEPDTWPPSVIRMEPKPGRVNGSVALKVTGRDNVAVKTLHAEFRKVGSEAWTSLGDQPAKGDEAVFTWNTKALEDGSYEIRAAAEDGAGNRSDDSFQQIYVTDNTGIGKIEIRDVKSDPTGIQIRWNDVKEEDFSHFIVEIWQNGKQTGTQYAGAVLGCYVNNLKPDTAYEFQVVGYDNLGNRGISSDRVAASTQSDTVPPVITQVGPQPARYNKNIPLYVEGQDNHGIAKAVFSYSLDGKTWAEAAAVSSSGGKSRERISYTLDIGGFEDGKITVRSEIYDIAGNHNAPLSDGNEVCVEYLIDRAAPKAVQGLTAESGAGYIKLSWEKNSEPDLECFEVYRANQSDGVYRLLDGTYRSLTYYDTKAAMGESYLYYVKARDQAGNVSDKGHVAAGTLLPDAEAPKILGMKPFDGTRVGPDPLMEIVASDNSCLSEITLEYRPKSESEEVWRTVGTGSVTGRSGYWSTRWNTAGLEEGEYIFRSVAKDMAGLASQEMSVTCTLDLTPPAVPQIEAEKGNLMIRLKLEGGQDADFSHFEILRRPSEGGSFQNVIRTRELSYQDERVTPEVFYDYKVRAYDMYGNMSESRVVSAYAADVDVKPPTAVVSENIFAIAGKEIAFDGTQSKDNKEIVSYQWKTGDGGSLTGQRPEYTYKKAGNYTAFLEVEDEAGNKNTAKTSVRVYDAAQSGYAEVVVRSVGGSPIPYAWIYVKTEGEDGIPMRADSQGRVKVAGRAAVYEVAAFQDGYMPSSILVHLSPYTSSQMILVLEKGDLIVGELTVRRMELQEMIEAGVDFSNPSNYHRYVFTFTVVLQETKIPVDIEYVGGSGAQSWWVGGSGGIGGGSIGGGSGTGGSGGGGTGKPPQTQITVDEIKPEEPVEDEAEEEAPPSLAYVSTTQTVEWLKEMYLVELGILNAAAPQYVIQDTTAVLNLPDGLSLAALKGSDQSLTVDMGDVAGQEKASASWVIKGDKSGKYTLSANVAGTLMPFGAPVSARFETESEFTAQTGEGLHLYIKPQSEAYIGENYYIQFELRNESEKNFYNLTTDFGPYTWEEEQVQWRVKNTMTGEETLAGTHIDDEGNKRAGAVFVRNDLNESRRVTILTGGDSVSVGVFGPGEVLYGTYCSPFYYPGDPETEYYKMIDYLVEVLEGENLGVQVTVSPISSHIQKYITEIRHAATYGDPVDVSTGAYMDDIEALDVTGGTTIGLDLNYNSILALNALTRKEHETGSGYESQGGMYIPRPNSWKGEAGIGFSHGYETKLFNDMGMIELSRDTGMEMFYISEELLDHTVYGQVSDNQVILDETAPYYGIYRCQTPGMEDSVILKKEDGTFELSGSTGDCVTFDNEGRMTKILQASGKSVSFTYDTGIMVIREDVSGKTVTYHYNEEGLLAFAEDQTGRRVTLTYDGGYLTQLVDTAGQTMTFAYENGLLVRSSNNRGEVYVANTYDGEGRVLTQKLPDSDTFSQFKYSRNESGSQTEITDHNGKLQRYEMDKANRIVMQQDGAGGVSRFTYNEKGWLVKEENPGGNITQRQYDEAGRVSSITDGDGNTTAMAYDDRGNLTQLTGPDGSVSRNTYDEHNRIISGTDPLGKNSAYVYDQMGNLTEARTDGLGTIYYAYENGLLRSIREYSGNETRMSYDSLGNMVSVTDAMGEITTYTYDPLRRKTSETNALGETTWYAYDNYGNLTEETNARGDVTARSYSPGGQLKTETLLDGTVIMYRYDAEGRVIEKECEDGRTWRYGYDSAGSLTSETDPSGRESVYSYGMSGRRTRVKDPRGNVTGYSYEKNGMVKQEQYADGSRRSYTYNANWLVTDVRDSSGMEIHYEYDALGNVTKERDALGNTNTYRYDIYGRMVSQKDPNGGTTRYAYDASGNCIKKTDAMGNEVSMEYDAMGRMTKARTNPGGSGSTGSIGSGESAGRYEASFEYDALGRVVSQTDEEGNTTKRQYDELGNVTSITDATGTTVSVLEYDAMGRVISSTDALGITDRASYDDAGNLSQTVSGSNTDAPQKTAYHYDASGRLLSVRDQAGNDLSQTYDACGNITTVTDAMGWTTDYTYDAMNRLSGETSPLGGSKGYFYNASGLLGEIRAEDGTGTKYSYDKGGRLTEKQDSLGFVRYTYDSNGNVLTVKDENGTITRTYDALNRVTSYTDHNGNTIRYGYDQLGNLVALTYPGGEIIRYSYYKNGWLKSVSDKAGTITEYTYDGAGRQLTAKNRNGTEELREYDAAGRMTSLNVQRKNPAGGLESVYSYNYTYDPHGNITSLSGKTPATSAITNADMEYDKLNRLIRYNGREVRYDARGNMVYGPLKGVMTEFTYDVRNRLIRTGTTVYEYDGEDTRTAVTTPEKREVYITDKSQALSRTLEIHTYGKEGNGYGGREESVITCVYGNGLILEAKQMTAVQAGSNRIIRYHHSDQVGSTAALTDETGTVTQTYAYGSYGELLSGDQSQTRFLYNGAYGVISDENGLYYMRARYYNVDIRRFINQDVVKGSIAGSQSLNRYSYAQGNPISLADPFGLSPYMKYSQIGHTVLDLIGFIPGLGDVADLMNCLWYTAEGNWTMAGLSLFNALPFIGSVIGNSFKMTAFGVDIGCTIAKGTRIVSYGYNTGKAGLGTLAGAGDMYKKYKVEGNKAGWDTIKEGGTVMLMGALTVISGNAALSSAMSKVSRGIDGNVVFGKGGLGALTTQNGNRVEDVVEGGSTRNIYRAVSPEEYDDIFATNSFRSRPDGRSFEAKQFGNNFDEILELANTPIMRDTAAIVEVTLPTEVYNGLNHLPLDVPILKSGAITVEPNMLENFNRSIIQIKHVY